MDNLNKYFNINVKKREKLLRLESIYREVNKKINVISRKDIDNIFLHHILPALTISKIIKFKNNSSVLDIGSGGGLPGLPLAIYFNKVNFTLIDSRNKKCEAMREVVKSLKLRNVNIKQIRSNELKEKFDYVIGRAVTKPEDFIKLACKNLKVKDRRESIFYIGGGVCEKDIKKIAISNFFDEEYFRDKYIYVQ